MNLNRVTIAGNLVRDPELRYTPKGTAIANIGVAVNRKWKSESGELKEEVTFVDCTFFGKTAEAIGQYFKKGRGIFVEGRLKLDSWTDKADGKNRQKLHVIGESFQFTDSKPSGERTQRPAAPAATGEEPHADPKSPEGDDVPF